MKRELRTMVAVAVIVAGMLALPTGSWAVGTASIEGTVTEAETPKSGIEGICVEAVPVGKDGVFKMTETESGGTYKITGLTAGAYTIVFANCLNGTANVLPRYWDEQSKSAKAEELDLAEGEKRTGIDAAMLAGGELTGRLETGKGTPIAGACVFAFAPETTESLFAFAETSANGEYTLAGLPSGRYVIEYIPCESGDFVAAYYDEGATGNRSSAPADATFVTVTAGASPIKLLAVALEAGAEIEGTLTDSEGALVTAPMCVYAINALKEAIERVHTKTGRYEIEGLPSGSYALFVEECSETELPVVWASQYYSGATSLASATQIALTASIEPPVPVMADFKIVRASARKPVNAALPTIAGIPAVGETLTCSPGSWTATPVPTYTYQWMRDGVTPIVGASGTQYTVQSTDEGDALSCVVTATNEAGSASAASATVQVPLPPGPPPSGGVAVVSGRATVKGGQAHLTLHCAGESACKGKLQLTINEHHGHKLATVMIAEASFSIPANGHVALDVHLTGKGKSLLAKAGKHGLSVTLSGSYVKSRTVLLKLASKGRRKHGKH